MPYDRIISKDCQPTGDEILETIGNTKHWLELREYLESAYDFAP